MTGKRIRILVATVDYPPIDGGISTLALELSRELARQGFEVTVLAPRFPGMETFDASEPARVVRFGGYGSGWFRLFPMLAAARALIPHHDLVLAINVAYGGIVGLFARSLFGVPYAAFAYGYEFLKFKRFWPAAALLRYIYAQSRGVIAISRYTRDQLAAFGVREKQIAAILPGAAPSPDVEGSALEAVRAKYPLDGKRLILSVGRMVPRKGHLTLVRAMARVINRVPNAHLVIVGQGPAMAACSRAAFRMGVRDNITFAGSMRRDYVQALYALCEVFALPTGEDRGGHVEGFGLVFAEAHAHGKPVVAGRSGGATEAVINEESGLLVEPDDAEGLADAIVRILLDAELARRLGEIGRLRVDNELNWRVFANQMLAVLGVRK
ncbi:MAG: glycosyltransferase family 4 protein [Candidatus Hydrogenedentes bacterium]|nr:glycosyltransferase family 4 protein [Candidatus Hydrogenedentota bacterium]